MPVAVVFTCSKEWTSGNTYATEAWTVGAGNALAVFVHINTTTANGHKFVSVSDGTNTYTQIDSHQSVNVNGADLGLCTFYVKNAAGASTTVTVTLSDTTNLLDAFVGIVEWSGVDTSSPLDGHSINPQTDPTTGANAITSDTDVATTANGNAITGFTRTQRGGTINLSSPNASDGTSMSFQLNKAGTPEATAISTGTQAASGSIATRFTADYSDAGTAWISAFVGLKASTATNWGGLLSDRLNRLVRS